MISIKRLEAILRGDPKVAPKSNLEQLLHSIKDSSGGTDELTVQSIVSAAVSDLVAEAPENLNTLKELADWISSHEETYSALTALVSEKQDIADMSNYVSFGEELEQYISVFINEHDFPGVVYESTLSEALSDYLSQDALNDYLSQSDLEGYLSQDALNDYLSQDALNDYLSQSDLEGYLSSNDLDGVDSLEVYVTNLVSDYIGEHVTTEALFQDYLSVGELSGYLLSEGFITSDELSEILSSAIPSVLALTEDVAGMLVANGTFNDYLSQSDLEYYLSTNASEIASMLQSYLTT